ncbi:hypothetical protein SESI111939_02925 [Serratia silvae]
MYKLLCCLVCLFLCASAHAVKWPTVEGLRITKCQTSWNEQVTHCSQNVWYQASGRTIMVEAPDRSDPGVNDTRVQLFGIYCGNGGGREGRPFTYCYWSTDYLDAPNVPFSVKCETTSSSSWVLTSASTCSYSSNVYGPHYGAGPGGECLMFGKASSPGSRHTTISTPWGDLSALTVANSGNTYCMKPVAPDIECEISIPGDGVLHHTNIKPSQSDVLTLSGELNCGGKPKVTIVGGGNLILGKGVTVDLSVSEIQATRFTLTSSLRTNNAEPGEYRTAVVLVASPY